MKTSRRLTQFVGVAILAVATLIVTTVHAGRIPDIKKKGELVCGVLGTDEPLSFLKDPMSREIVGYDVDICDVIAKSLGVKPTLKQLAAAARLPELQQDRVDLLAASLTHNKERETQIDFSVLTFITGQRAMVKKSSGTTSLVQFDGKKLLTVKGSTIEASIVKTVKNADVASFDNSPQTLLALQQGKGVVHVNDEATLIGNMAEMGPAAKDYTLLLQNLSTECLALGIRKGESAFRKQVGDVLLGMEKSGEVQKLFDKWFGPNTKMALPQRTSKISTDKID